MKIPRDFVNTFSIVGRDPETNELGVAVASKFLSVGALVPWAKAGVGAIATQSWVNQEYGKRGLELMAEGKTAEEVMDLLTASDDNKALRQAGFVDANGNSASYTGSECYSWAGSITGPNFACQGNILVGEEVIQRMAQAFQNSEGDLSERLIAALLAGDEAGGDSRGKQSAALLVVKENGGYGGFDDRYIDIRVDEHTEPVKELKRILYLHQLYFTKSKPEDILKVEGELKAHVAGMLTTLNYLTSADTSSDEEVFEALKSFHLIENFDERIQDAGFVDKKVVEFMEGLNRED